jgi:hypothetical protein
MRVLACLLLAGCIAGFPEDPTAPSRTLPRRQAVPLRDSLRSLCAATSHATSLADFGPHVLPKVTDAALKNVLLDVRDGRISIIEMRDRIESLMATAHVVTCPALDRLMRHGRR